MFGKFVFSLLLTVLGLPLNEAFGLGKNETAKANLQYARVIEADASVYSDADFDSNTMGSLKLGSKIVITKEVFGPFYKVFLGQGKFGYVSDVEVEPWNNKKKAPRTFEEAKKEKQKKWPFSKLNFWGVEFATIRYREDTLGQRPTDNRFAIGFRATGPQIAIDGVTTDFRVLLSPGAPNYYEQATGKPADGFAFWVECLMLSTLSQSSSTLTQFGFGPLYRYSKFNVTLPVNGKDEPYSLDDMALGADFQLGLTQRISQGFATRLDLNYRWEKLQYWSASLSFQFRGF